MNCRNVSFLASVASALFFVAACGDTKTTSPSADGTSTGGGSTTGGGSSTTGGGATTGGGSATTGGGGTTGGTTAGNDGGPPVTVDAGVDAAPEPNSGLPEKPGSVPGGSTPQTAPVVCSRETTGLSLAQLQPTASAPAAFRTAWKQEQQSSQAPPLVFGLRGLTKGPVAGSLGPVHAVSPTTWQFETPPLTARTVNVTVDPANPLHIMVPVLSTTAITSFGDNNDRRGFTIIGFTLDGTLGGQCESIVGTMHFLIPGSNSAQPFAGTTIGALLGSLTADSDGDGTADAWSVDFAGTASFVTVESTP